ncbi:MAG TPA: GyrI-like domain-containing protein [Clostridia bacterium]|nr:GyrI-like domain-containing protein [Clostridia bacterium]
MKYECKKDQNALLGAKQTPEIIVVPRWNFIALGGEGDPNQEDFTEHVGALYSLAYTLKFAYKAACVKDPGISAQSGYDDFSVFPLEGVWNTKNTADPRDKASYLYTIMIRQPDFITKDLFEAALETARRKKPHPLLGEIAFLSMEDGLCVQALHAGPFDDEPATFVRMDRLVAERGYARAAHIHREIYFSDTRKTTPEKLRTILRYRIKAR